MQSIHFLDKNQPEVGGEATTCRKGLRWYNQVNVDDEVNLVLDGAEIPNHIIGRAVVTRLWFGWFRQVPALFLEIEHDPTCRTYSGLFAGMKAAYDGFKDTDLVTVIQYRRTE